MTTWFFSTTIGRWTLGAGVAILFVLGLAARYYFKGKNAAQAEAIEATLKRVSEGLQARRREQENPTDELTDPFNRDRRDP